VLTVPLMLVSLTGSSTERAGVMENEDDVINDACGVFGCVTAGPWPNTVVNVAADVIYPALANLQHRYVDDHQ